MLMSYSRIAFLQHDRMSRPHLPRGGVASRHNLSSSFSDQSVEGALKYAVGIAKLSIMLFNVEYLLNIIGSLAMKTRIQK